MPEQIRNNDKTNKTNKKQINKKWTPNKKVKSKWKSARTSKTKWFTFVTWFFVFNADSRGILIKNATIDCRIKHPTNHSTDLRRTYYGSPLESSAGQQAFVALHHNSNLDTFVTARAQAEDMLQRLLSLRISLTR